MSNEYIFYSVIKFFVSRLPRKVSYIIAAKTAFIFFIFSRQTRHNVYYNLKQIYSTKNETFSENVDLHLKTKQVFKNFAKYMVDLFGLAVWQKEEISKLFLEICGEENLDFITRKDKGAIIVTLHLGNWELGGAFLSHYGCKVSVIFEGHKDERVTNFFNDIRQRHGMEIVERRDIKDILSKVKGKKIIAILGDLNFDNQTVPVNFLGIKYELPVGPIILAMRFDVPIVTAVCIQSGDGYKILINPIFQLQKTGHLQKDIHINAQLLANELEDFIKKYPEQWFVFRRME